MRPVDSRLLFVLFLTLSACAAPLPMALPTPPPKPSLTVEPVLASQPQRRPPPDIQGRYLPGIGIELTWTPEVHHPGCRITRRNVLVDEPPRPIRHSAACDGLFVDTDVTAGAVYAYRVATFRQTPSTPVLSQATPDLYVTVDAPETP